MASSFLLGADGIYRCPAFEQFHWQTHGFGTRQANPETDVTLRQIHSSLVWRAGGLKDREQEGDSLVTNQAGLRIGVRTADCVPVLLLDAERKTIAAVHAGWRGSAAEIVTGAIQEMDAEAANIWVAIGPCIRKCCYEVGDEVAEHFTKWTNPAAKPNGKRNLDLVEANIRQLEMAGVPHEQILDSTLCTYCQIETFYSFRREPNEPGRMVSAICLR